jgi:hypothetical protein
MVLQVLMVQVVLQTLQELVVVQVHQV